MAKTARDLGRALVLKSVKARKAKPAEREMAPRTAKPRARA